MGRRLAWRKVNTAREGGEIHSVRYHLHGKWLHRKWRETKQQPSMLPGPAVPGCCFVSFHFVCYIHHSCTVDIFERLENHPKIPSGMCKHVQQTRIKPGGKVVGIGTDFHVATSDLVTVVLGRRGLHHTASGSGCIENLMFPNVSRTFQRGPRSKSRLSLYPLYNK